MGYSLSKAINTSVVIITVANVHISILYLKPSLVHFNVHRSVFLTTRSHQNAFCKILQSLDTVTSNKISLIYCFKLGEMTDTLPGRGYIFQHTVKPKVTEGDLHFSLRLQMYTECLTRCITKYFN